VRTPERYIAAVESGASARAGEEQLDAPTRAEEAFALALRTRRGAVAAAAAGPLVAELEAEELLEQRGDRILLTVRGRLLASDLTARLLLAGAASRHRRAAGSLALGSIEC
jgi:oxygen-independent coproporphyrinogen-3 oxidase